MNKKLDFLNSIKNQTAEFVDASRVIEPDDECDYHTLVLQYSGKNLKSVKLDLSFITDTNREKIGFAEIQVFVSLIEDFQMRYFRDLIWTTNKLNYILPSGQLAANSDINSLYFKQTFPVNLTGSTESQCFAICKSLEKSVSVIDNLMVTLNAVATGTLPSKAIKLNPWSDYL
mgnify:CR=1 FL=1|jgi:hypothetical protein